MDETFERLRREWIGSEASHIASPSEQLDEACSEAVIKGYHQGSVMRRACSRGPRDLRRVYGIGSMLTGPQARDRAGSIGFRGKWQRIFLQSPGSGGKSARQPD